CARHRVYAMDYW
nr:immunoglobulin heavy chain junction region [Mus musculus]